MAGSALHNGYSVIPRRNWAQRLALRLGLNTTSEREILSFLETMEPKRIVEAEQGLLTLEELLEEGLSMAFGPTIEPFDTHGVFLDDDIPKLVQSAWGNDISIMIGATSKETLQILPTIRVVPEVLNYFGNFEFYIPRELNVSRGSEESKKYAEILKETYYGRLTPTVTNVDGILTASADSLVWYPAWRTIQYRLKAESAATFVYRFDADTQNNVIKGLLSGVEFYREPTHGDDVAHLFKSILHLPMSQMNATTIVTLRVMLTSFTNFAMNGNPGSWLTPTWPSVGSQPGDNENLLVGMNIHEHRREFRTLPEEVRAKKFNTIFEMERGGAATLLASGIFKISFLILMKHFLL